MISSDVRSLPGDTFKRGTLFTSVHLRSVERSDPSPVHSQILEKTSILKSVKTTLTPDYA